MCIYLYGAVQKLDVIFFKKVRFTSGLLRYLLHDLLINRLENDL
jgi:hypothetical protein